MQTHRCVCIHIYLSIYIYTHTQHTHTHTRASVVSNTHIYIRTHILPCIIVRRRDRVIHVYVCPHVCTRMHSRLQLHTCWCMRVSMCARMYAHALFNACGRAALFIGVCSKPAAPLEAMPQSAIRIVSYSSTSWAVAKSLLFDDQASDVICIQEQHIWKPGSLASATVDAERAAWRS